MENQIDFRIICEITGRILLEGEIRERQLAARVERLEKEKQQLLSQLMQTRTVENVES